MRDSQWLSFDGLHQIEVDNIFTSIKEVEYRLYYEAKQKYFKQLLSKCESYYNSYGFVPALDTQFFLPAHNPSPYCYVDDSFEPVNFCKIVQGPSQGLSYSFESFSPYCFGLSQKEQILIELIDIAGKLKTYYHDDSLRERFNILEHQLSTYLDGFDKILLEPDIYSSCFVVHETKEELKLLRNRLRSTLKKKIGIFLRDIRESFRNIIKFLFKNMDDESDRSNALELVLCSALFDFKNIHHYAKEGNYRTSKYCT